MKCKYSYTNTKTGVNTKQIHCNHTRALSKTIHSSSIATSNPSWKHTIPLIPIPTPRWKQYTILFQGQVEIPNQFRHTPRQCRCMQWPFSSDQDEDSNPKTTDINLKEKGLKPTNNKWLNFLFFHSEHVNPLDKRRGTQWAGSIHLSPGISKGPSPLICELVFYHHQNLQPCSSES